MKRFILFLSLFSFFSSALAQKEIPELQGRRVHDEANVLSRQTVDYLEQTLKIFEDSTSNQLAILIVPSLESEVIETFSIRVAEKWKLGTKDKDNGAILIVSINDRKMRIEVGQGLEGPLPDAICNRIIRNEMVPSFRRGDYDAGVNAAMTAIMQAVKGEYHVDEQPRRRQGKGSAFLTVLIIVIIIILRSSGRNKRGGGGWSSGAGWFIGGTMAGRGWGGGGGGGGFSGGGGSFGGGGSSGSW
ncbi:MAG TPA: TPM domain-containing protein [Cyclobacteriaceae bacterium]|nr:TPM domain-containing protein [Cyclobacteriaceae bacterium]